ncbi:MAG TPA: hypothetical protein ENI79_05905 [Rhodospirillales bacterium]|nr:hypothetical protein [Rhodospirillales bacterium]
MADIRNITPFWSGDYMVFWKPPPVYWRDLKPGMQGEDVAWLRKRLEEIQGEYIETDKPDSFDEVLKNQVAAFHISRKLRGDGNVGALTFIHINTLAGDGTIPVLSKP